MSAVAAYHIFVCAATRLIIMEYS